MAGHWVVKTVRGELGPVTAEQLKTLAASKRISGSTFVRPAGSDRWVAAGRVEGLFESPKFPSNEDGAWSEPLEDTGEASSADATMDEDVVLDLLGDASPTASAIEITIPPPPPPRRSSGKRNGVHGAGKLTLAQAVATAASSDEDAVPQAPWTPVRLTVVAVLAAVVVILILDGAARFAITMSSAESHRTVGLMAGVASPLLRDGLVLAGLLIAAIGPLFWLGMLVHCLKHETRGGVEKLTWTIVLLTLNILGAILYCIIERPRVEAERK